MVSTLISHSINLGSKLINSIHEFFFSVFITPINYPKFPKKVEAQQAAVSQWMSKPLPKTQTLCETMTDTIWPATGVHHSTCRLPRCTSLEVFIRVIRSVSDRYNSIRLYFGCVLRRVTLGSSRLVTVRLKIDYSNYRISISSVSVEVRVKFQSVAGCHRLIIGSVFYRVQIGFGYFSSRTWLRIANY